MNEYLIDFMPIGCDVRLQLIRQYDLGLTRQDWHEGAQISQWAGSDGRTVVIDRNVGEPGAWEDGCTHYMAVLATPENLPWEAL